MTQSTLKSGLTDVGTYRLGSGGVWHDQLEMTLHTTVQLIVFNCLTGDDDKRRLNE
jgi:hypothetical protein